MADNRHKMTMNGQRYLHPNTDHPPTHFDPLEKIAFWETKMLIARNTESEARAESRRCRYMVNLLIEQAHGERFTATAIINALGTTDHARVQRAVREITK
jgi:hypothetical protein